MSKKANTKSIRQAQDKLRRKVLVVDDDPTIVESTCLILKEWGYETIPMLDGKKIYAMKNDFPDVMLLDVWMSGEDGRDIAKYLKKKEPTKNIPIIMISASRNLEKSAKEAGANDFLEKPFDMQDLLDKVEYHAK